MFSKAVPIAAGFTRPVVISSRTTQGACAGTIGAYVVANRAGHLRVRPRCAAGCTCSCAVVCRRRESSGFRFPASGDREWDLDGTRERIVVE